MKVTKSLKMLIAMFIFLATFAMSGKKVEAYGVVTQVTQTKDTVTINWEPEDTAIEYYIGIAESYSESLNLANTKAIIVPNTQTSYTFTNLKPGSNYYVCVKYKYIPSYINEERIGSVSSETVTTLPGKVTGVKQSKWWYFIEQVDFEWDDQTAAKYEVKFMNSKGKTIDNIKPYSNGSSHSVKNNKLYKVKVRANVTINNQVYYGEWSDSAYLFTQPMLKKVRVDGSKLKMTWGKINGTTSYSIYVSRKEKSGYKKVKTLSKSKSSYTLSKLKGKKISKKKTYYVYIVAKKKVGNKTYTSGRHYTEKVKGSSHSLRWTFD